MKRRSNKNRAPSLRNHAAAKNPSLETIEQPQQMMTMHHYQGAIPPPAILDGFERIVPGCAEKIVNSALQESIHRRDIEHKSMDANIAAQNQDLNIKELQVKLVFRSDAIGQWCGFITCILCAGGAVYFGVIGKDFLAASFLALPSAAVIKSFFVDKNK